MMPSKKDRSTLCVYGRISENSVQAKFTREAHNPGPFRGYWTGVMQDPASELPRITLLEIVRKGTRAVCGACILVASGSEIGLLGPALSTFETSVRSLWGLFGQFL